MKINAILVSSKTKDHLACENMTKEAAKAIYLVMLCSQGRVQLVDDVTATYGRNFYAFKCQACFSNLTTLFLQGAFIALIGLINALPGPQDPNNEFRVEFPNADGGVRGR